MNIAKIIGDKIQCPYCGREEKGSWAVDFKHLDTEYTCLKCKRLYQVLAGSVGGDE